MIMDYMNSVKIANLIDPSSYNGQDYIWAFFFECITMQTLVGANRTKIDAPI